MNSLVLLNGSPRGERSNSMKMLARVAEGWQHGGGQKPEVLHLAHRTGFDRAVKAFAEADTLVLGMPLYTDAMPALVKSYIEALQPRTAAVEGATRRSASWCNPDFRRRVIRVRWSATCRSWRGVLAPAMWAPLCAARANRCR